MDNRSVEPDYYSIGHDQATSLVPGTLIKKPFDDIACLSCGIGDARNLFASFQALGTTVQKDKSADSSSKVVHFTPVDLKPAVFARDIIVFRILLDAETGGSASKEEKEWLSVP